MTDNSALEALLSIRMTNREAAVTIINEAMKAYMRDLSNIAADIYDSCIKDYYAQYDPIKYTRHGDKKGFNLYSANNIDFDEASYNINIDFDPGKLLGYYDGKQNREKRDKVLNAVMSGLRGTRSKKSPPGWPQLWLATYPNRYSEYSVWISSEWTMDGIFKDFMTNVMNDTMGLWYSHIKNFL